jgi:hypothetical protein
MRREKTQVNKIRNANGDITTNMEEIQEIIRDYYFEIYIQINWKILKKWTNF